jgi:S-formylglutathione hydrolase FrmB
MALFEVNLFSSVLNLQTEVWVTLPEKAPEGKLKVLWFMPGGHADASSWVRTSAIERMASRRGVAVVMPGCYNSSCVNMHRWHPVNRYIGTELVPAMRAMFPAFSHDRMDNMISGFSNGGYGSFNLALTYPEIFGWGAPFGAGDKADVDWSGKEKERNLVYGDVEMKTSDYSLRTLGNRLIASDRPRPILFHGCGEFDPWRDMNESVRDYILSIPGDPFSYQFSIAEGCGHDGDAVRILLERFFDRAGLPIVARR